MIQGFTGRYLQLKKRTPLPLSISFFSNFFLPFLYIFLQQWLTFHWDCFQFKSFWESIFEKGNSYQGVAKCSRMKFWAFSCISQAPSLILCHWKNHFLLQNLVKMMLILVNDEMSEVEQTPILNTAGYSQHGNHRVKNANKQQLLLFYKTRFDFQIRTCCKSFCDVLTVNSVAFSVFIEK